ncbi:DUF3617 domain-containing protein [Sphingosinicella terrae]|uniref:DUF3617 domain-containing protein n=1 Tax=Sphingosinicella terrae TaxID=2172047 RepID=UPI0013B3BE7B|nr:DUF3617 domain-containing protein [Sphingosinicella terrae]
MRPAAPFLIAALIATGGCGDRADPSDMSAEQVADQLAGMRIEPGLWELTSEVVEVSAPGLPREVRNRMIGPRRQMRHCITPAQAERPEANFLAVRADSDCAYRRFTVENGRMRGEMTCPDAQAQMDGRYGPEGYDLRMVMESPMPEGEVRMTLQIRARGRRIGACEEGSEG